MWWCVSLVLILVGSSRALLQTDVLLKLYTECSRTDWQSCLKIKLLAGLEKLRNVETVPVMNGISFVDENYVDVPSYYVPYSEKTLDEGLPRSIDARNRMLDSMLLDEISQLMSKYTLKLKLSTFRYPIEEARGKGKKHHLIMMPLMMFASSIPIALGTLAILAGKALIVGKMALLLTSIMGIKKLLSSNHEDDDHQRAMKRISDFGMMLRSDMMMPHKMAYKGHQASEMMKTSSMM